MPIDRAVATATAYPDRRDSWDEAGVILYHLGLGAGAPPTDVRELEYVNERTLKVLPTFSVIPGFEAVRPAVQGAGLDYKLSRMLHGEQETVVHRPLPPCAEVISSARVAAVWDKGSAAVVVLEATTRTAAGEPLCTNRFRLFVGGEGGFSGDPGPAPTPWEATGEPLMRVDVATLPQQAAIYRLSGDRNPLHLDPAFAAKAGFDRPILHGLCTYGIVCKAVVDHALGGDTTGVAAYSARFAGTVYPGETLEVAAWRLDGGLAVQATVKERGVVALANGLVTLVDPLSATPGEPR
jgi:acyl dehydratase